MPFLADRVILLTPAPGNVRLRSRVLGDTARQLQFRGESGEDIWLVGFLRPHSDIEGTISLSITAAI